MTPFGPSGSRSNRISSGAYFAHALWFHSGSTASPEVLPTHSTPSRRSRDHARVSSTSDSIMVTLVRRQPSAPVSTTTGQSDKPPNRSCQGHCLQIRASKGCGVCWTIRTMDVKQSATMIHCGGNRFIPDRRHTQFSANYIEYDLSKCLPEGCRKCLDTRLHSQK